MTKKNTVSSLKNHCLVAMPSLDGSLFERSVILICGHTKKGAQGLMLTHPLEVTFGDLLVQLNLSVASGFSKQAKPIFCGGPVSPENGFVLHTGTQAYTSSILLEEGLSLTASMDILKAMAYNKGPSESQIFLGSSQWDAGQVEREIETHLWLVVPFTLELLFTISVEKRWAKAVQLAGIQEPYQLVKTIGHG